MTFVIKLYVNIASSQWIGHRGSPTSTLDNTTSTCTVRFHTSAKPAL